MSGSLDFSITNTLGDPNQPGPPGPAGEPTGALNPGTQVAGTTCLLVSAGGKAVGWITFGGNVQPLGKMNLLSVLASCGGSISPSGNITGPNTQGQVPSWDSMTPVEQNTTAVYGALDTTNPSNNGETEGGGRG